MVLHHACLQASFADYRPSLVQKILLFWFQNGHYSVDFFIVLSGYCLMIPAGRDNYQLVGGLAHFFKRRAKRILPPYYLAVAFSLVLIFSVLGRSTGTHWDSSIPVTTTDLLTHLLLVQDVLISTCHKINHVFWSISVEWRIYFAFPLLLLLWRTTGPVRTVAVVAITSLVLLGALHYAHILHPNINDTPNGLVPHYLLLFTLGMLGADIALVRKQLFSTITLNQLYAGVAFTSFLLFGASVLSEINVIISWQLLDVIVGMWSVGVLLVCNKIQTAEGTFSTLLKSAVNWKPLVFVGTFGYSLYLIHAPILQLLSQYVVIPLHLNPFLSFVFLSLVGLPIILLVAYGFFLACEKPFMVHKKPTLETGALVNTAV